MLAVRYRLLSVLLVGATGAVSACNSFDDDVRTLCAAPSDPTVKSSTLPELPMRLAAFAEKNVRSQEGKALLGRLRTAEGPAELGEHAKRLGLAECELITLLERWDQCPKQQTRYLDWFDANLAAELAKLEDETTRRELREQGNAQRSKVTFGFYEVCVETDADPACTEFDPSAKVCDPYRKKLEDGIAARP